MFFLKTIINKIHSLINFHTPRHKKHEYAPKGMIVFFNYGSTGIVNPLARRAGVDTKNEKQSDEYLSALFPPKRDKEYPCLSAIFKQSALRHFLFVRRSHGKHKVKTQMSYPCLYNLHIIWRKYIKTHEHRYLCS